jgi:IS5 family transposase
MNRNPLMPCKEAAARVLLKQRKAKVKRREPFTIELLYKTAMYTQPLTLGIDTGSTVLAGAVVDGAGSAVYLSEVEIRNDISKKMTQRHQYRRDRRNRKTRYRQARWQNRSNSKQETRAVFSCYA